MSAGVGRALVIVVANGAPEVLAEDIEVGHIGQDRRRRCIIGRAEGGTLRRARREEDRHDDAPFATKASAASTWQEITYAEPRPGRRADLCGHLRVGPEPSLILPVARDKPRACPTLTPDLDAALPRSTTFCDRVSLAHGEHRLSHCQSTDARDVP